MRKVFGAVPVAVSILIVAVFLSSPITLAQAPAPVSGLSAVDTDNDHGHSITIKWTISADDGAGSNSVIGYRILRSSSAGGPFDTVGVVPLGSTSYENSSSIEAEATGFIPDNMDFYFRVEALTGDPN